MGFGEGSGEGSGDARGKTQRVAVPAMPMPLAVVCCILNFLVPGLGTILAGLSAFCCARNEDMQAGSRIGSCCIGLGIGLLQLLTVALLLLGWIWSCVWGVFFLGMSAEYYHDNPPDSTRGAIITQQPQGAVTVQPAGSGYPHQQFQQAQPVQPQPAAGYYPAPGGYQQPYPAPQQQPYQPPPQQPYQTPPQNYPGSGPDRPMYAGEPPPPYTESSQAQPSAPPEEKFH